MATTTFGTENSTYRQLLSGGRIFRIPRFQRDYSWKEEHWEDLWSDVLDLLADNDSGSHYMGYLVVQPKSDDALDIIDGQQRLTTLSLLVLSAMRKLKDLKDSGIDVAKNEARLDEIRRTYIGQLDTVSLEVSPKLSLNRNNNSYYQTYLVTLRSMPSRGFKASEHSMRKATDWFGRKISEYLSSLKDEDLDRGGEIAKLVDKISRGLFFTVITVDDELNAYKVFETLNARGVKLAAPDLLKNYLFSVISRDTSGQAHDTDLDRAEQRWSNILERLQSENITSYLRAYWGSTNSFVRQADLFKVIKRQIQDRGDAYRLIEGLEDGVESFLSLAFPEQSEWDRVDKDNASLLKMFSVRQPFALLMAARSRIPSEFSQILAGIVSITMRYNVISNLQAAEQERTYSRVAIAISKGELKLSGEVLKELRSIYPNDSVFRANFETKTLDTSSSRNKQIVRYILAKLDAQIANKPYSFPRPEITVEHILPENPGENWPQFTDQEADAEVYRLGNMALLEEKKNREIGNQEYSKKRPQLKASSIGSTSQIAEDYAEWNVDSINQNQAKMAVVATGIWRVSQLH